MTYSLTEEEAFVLERALLSFGLEYGLCKEGASTADEIKAASVASICNHFKELLGNSDTLPDHAQPFFSTIKLMVLEYEPQEATLSLFEKLEEWSR